MKFRVSLFAWQAFKLLHLTSEAGVAEKPVRKIRSAGEIYNPLQFLREGSTMGVYKWGGLILKALYGA